MTFEWDRKQAYQKKQMQAEQREEQRLLDAALKTAGFKSIGGPVQVSDEQKIKALDGPRRATKVTPRPNAREAW